MKSKKKSLLERCVSVKVYVDVFIPLNDGTGICKKICVLVDAMMDPEDYEVYLNGEVLEELDRIKAKHMGVMIPKDVKQLTSAMMSRQNSIFDMDTSDGNGKP